VTSGTEKRVRSHVLTLRLSAEERAAVDQAAERAGLVTGSYARQVLLGAPAPRQVRRPPVERRELVRLLGELGKVGGNLNQLAKAVHTGVLVYEGEIDAALAGVMQARDAILKALGRAPPVRRSPEDEAG
jgi:Bacterial mobilisation protein (MobC)